MGLHRFAQENPNWRTGRSKQNGYILIYQPLHPHAMKKKYVYEHRLVMEASLERYLNPNEAVHHINGLRDDNRLKNLSLMTRGEHTTVNNILNNRAYKMRLKRWVKGDEIN